MFTLCVVAKNDQEVDTWKSIDTTYVDNLHIIQNANGPGYGVIGKQYLDTHREKHGENGVFGLVHGDTWFDVGAIERFVRIAEAGNCAGIVGRGFDNAYVWCNRQDLHTSKIVTVRGGGGEVSCFDGCAIFFPVASGLDLDVITFDGHHCVVEDMCLNARSRGMRLVVPDANADHRASAPTADWSGQWKTYTARLRRKYPKLQWQQC